MSKGKYKFIVYALILSAAAWVMDAVVDYFLLHRGDSFLNALILDVPIEDIFNRLLVVASIIFFMGIIYRIYSHHRQTRAALSQGEHLLESIFNNFQEGLIIRDQNFNIIRANAVAEGWYSHASPLVGKKCYQALRKRNEPCQSCPSSEAMQTGRSAQGVFPKIGPGGETTGWLEVSSFPIMDPATGKATGVITIARDITQRQAAEAALRESENRYRLLVQHIPAVVFRGYPDWTVEFLDDKIEELTGFAKEEFNSRRMKWSDLILPEDLQGMKKKFVEALKTTKSYEREYRIKDKAGKIRWVQGRGQIICDAAGQVEYISGVFFDITQRKEAEEALRCSEASLAQAQRIAHLGNWEWNIPADELSWSDEVYRMLGLAPQELRPTHETFLNFIHPDDLMQVKQGIGEALKSGQPSAIEYRIVLRDGSLRFIHSRGEVYFDNEGQPLRAVGTMQDITEFKQMQIALAESERRYRLLAENVTDVIFTMDMDLRINYVSPAVRLLTGYSPEEVQGWSLEQLVTPASAEMAQRIFMEELTLETQQPYSSGARVLELEHLCKDGSTVWVEVKANFSRDDQGNLVGVQGVTRDITARRQLEEQLRQAQKMEMVGRLAGGVAHDFNNLLTAILGYSGLLLSRIEPNHPAHHDITEIQKAGERAALLTRQLLAFSRRQVLQPNSLDLNEVVENLAKMLKRVIGEDIQLQIFPEAQLGRVMADPGQIEQVILNLAVNARDAMPEGGRLNIRTANVVLDEAYAQTHAEVQPGLYVLLEVNDSGSGMDAATRSHIFEPFFTTKEKGKGTGLGLSTVYGIIRQSGGYIWVYSEPGEGTTFKIYLPRIEVATEISREKRAMEAALTGKETILLVEDDDLVRQIARRILQRSGYTVLEAQDGREAQQMYEHHRGAIHLLLTDLVMPGMNGRELADHLVKRSPEIKVMFMSGYAESGIVNQSMMGPGKAFIQKPFEAYMLTRRVRELLDAA